MSKRILGLWNMGDGMFHKILSPRDSKHLIKEAIKSGIIAFDSAYSYKSADNYLYSALKELSIDRKDIEIISKVMPVPTLNKKVSISLNRLHTDYLDALLLHWPSDTISVYNAMRELENLHQKGRAKEIGVSNFPLSLLEKIAKDFPITIHERPLSLIWCRDFEEEKALGLKTYGYAPLGMGTLAKEMNLESDINWDNALAGFDDSRKNLYIFKEGLKEYKILMKEIGILSARYNCTFSDIALSWVDSLDPHAIIFGASRIEHLKYRKINLETEEFDSLSELSASLGKKAPSDNIFSHDYLLH